MLTFEAHGVCMCEHQRFMRLHLVYNFKLQL